jgi:hypothetical protein
VVAMIRPPSSELTTAFNEGDERDEGAADQAPARQSP